MPTCWLTVSTVRTLEPLAFWIWNAVLELVALCNKKLLLVAKMLLAERYRLVASKVSVLLAVPLEPFKLVPTPFQSAVGEVAPVPIELMVLIEGSVLPKLLKAIALASFTVPVPAAIQRMLPSRAFSPPPLMSPLKRNTVGLKLRPLIVVVPPLVPLTHSDMVVAVQDTTTVMSWPAVQPFISTVLKAVLFRKSSTLSLAVRSMAVTPIKWAKSLYLPYTNG